MTNACAMPTGSAFLAHGFFTDADVLDGIVKMMLGAIIIGRVLLVAVLLLG